MPSFYSSPTPPPPKKKGRSFGGLLSHALGDIPEIGRAIAIDLPVSIGKNVGYSAADILRGKPERIGERALRGADVFAKGITGFLPRLPGEDIQVFGKDPKGRWRFMYRWEDPDDAGSALEAIYENPLAASLSVLPGVGGATRVGSVTQISKRIRQAHPEVSRYDAVKLASAESRNPGSLKVWGIEGGIEPRTLKVSGPSGTREVTLPRSGSALGRGIEDLYDVSSRKLETKGPKALSESARAARYEKRQGKERLREQQAEVAGLFRPILDLAYRHPGVRGFLAGRKEKTKEATALTALLQLPKELTTKEALEAYLGGREKMLHEGVYTKAVHSSMDDLIDGEGRDAAHSFVGTTVRIENPNKGEVWELESLGDDHAIVTRHGQSRTADLDEVYPVKLRGGRYGPAFREQVPLDEESANLIRGEMSDLKRVLENPPNAAAFEKALASLERISELTEMYGYWINARNLTAAQRRKLGQRYERRKQLIINDLVQRGLIPEGHEARGYFPHFSLWRALAANWAGPVRLPSSGLVVGRPQLRAEVARRNPNDLILHQLGQVNMDPSALTYLLSLRLRYAETFAMRKDYYDIAKPLNEIEGKMQGGYLIRDPDAASKAISDRTKAELSLSDEEYAKLVRQGEDTASVLDDPENVSAEPRDWLASTDGPAPDWTREDGVRWLPSHIVEARFGRRVFRGEAPSMLGLGNAFARLSLILARPLRYSLSNVPSNYLMLLATNPGATLRATKLLASAATGRLPHGVDRELLEQIRSQSGEVRATAGIPHFTTSRVTRLEKLESETSRQSSRIADFLGTRVDEPFRIAVWMERAERMGFDTPEEWRRLLAAKGDGPLVQARQQLRQRTRDDLLDFDSLTQWEREQATRYLFVWPYLRAATKWPFIYARERPVAAGLIGTAALAAPNVPLPLPIPGSQGANEVEIAGKRFDLSQLNPLSPVMEASGTARRLARGDLSAAADYLTPTLGLASGITEGGLTARDTAWKALGTFAPYGQAARNVGDNGWRSALAEEALRFTPRRPYRAVRRDKREEADAISDHYGAIFDEPLFRTSFNAYWSYRDLYTRAQTAQEEQTGSRKLTEPQKAALLRLTWRRFFPDQEMPAFPPSQEANEVYEAIMFRPREYLAHGLPDE